jgi:hypothetical protein
VRGPTFFRREVHDPERAAASYLCGERTVDRERFESHLMACEECWAEVRAGQRGRRLAEAAREIAPPALREEVRAAILLERSARPRPFRVIGAVMGLVALGVAGLMVAHGARRPQPVEAALAMFRSSRMTMNGPASRPAPDLSAVGLRLLAAGRAELGGFGVDLFSYGGPARGRVLVLVSDRAFSPPRGAVERTGTTHGWVASDDGVSMICAARPVHYLLLGLDPRLLVQAEAALRAELAGEGD